MPISSYPAERQQVEREAYLVWVSRRLIWVTLSVLLAVVIGTFGLTLAMNSRFPMSWYCFGLGVLGGFVSLQQRLSKIDNRELLHLRFDWVNVLILPVFGGISALIFYLFTLAGAVEGVLIPSYSVPQFADPVTTEDLTSFFTQTYPSSGTDFAKLSIWAVVAGFSERFVPGLLGKLGKRGDQNGSNGE